MLMHDPPHPGEVLKELCLEPLGLTVTDAAKALGVSRKTLSMVVNGRAGMSPEMAIRLSIAFDTSAESWLNQQIQFDLWQAEQHRSELKVERLLVCGGIGQCGKTQSSKKPGVGAKSLLDASTMTSRLSGRR